MYLTQSLHRNLQQDPDRPATIYRDRTRTMAESVDRIARLAGALPGLGAKRGDRVGILALNSDRYQEYFHAVPWMGAAINPVNIRWSPAEISYSLVESDTRVLFVDDAFAPMIPALREQFPGLSTVIHCADSDMSSLVHLVYGASPISEALLERARKVFPAAGFTQAYGMTELSPCATLLTPADHDNPALHRSAGRAAPHVEVRIVNPNDEEVPRGEVGEVVVRGDNV